MHKRHATNKSLLYSISLTLFINALAQGLTFPLIPELFLNSELGLIRNSDTFLSKEFMYSVALALFPLSSVLGMPILGLMSDVYGRKSTILCGFSAMLACEFLNIISILLHSVWLFLACVLLSGFLSGTYAAGEAIVSDMSNDEKERISNFKLPTLASLAGFIFGPALSTFVGNINYTNHLVIPFVIALALGMINIILLRHNMKNYRDKNLQPHSGTKIKNGNPNFSNTLIIDLVLTSITYIFNNKKTKTVALAFLLLQFAVNLFAQSRSFNLAFNYQYTPSQIGEFFLVMAIIVIFSMYLLQKLISYFISQNLQLRLALILMSLILMLGAKVAATSYSAVSLVWIISILFHLCLPIINLGFINLFASIADQEERGRVMGGSGQLSAIAACMSGIMIGQLAQNSILILMISSICVVLSYIVLIRYSRETLDV